MDRCLCCYKPLNYRNEAMDIDSDIRVMENMLRRDTASVEDDFGIGGAAVQHAPDEE